MDGHGKPCVPHARFTRVVSSLTVLQYPIGMGTGAVYVTLAGLKNHPGHPLTVVETVFYFLNMVLFLLNTSTLLLQFASEYSHYFCLPFY